MFAQHCGGPAQVAPPLYRWGSGPGREGGVRGLHGRIDIRSVSYGGVGDGFVVGWIAGTSRGRPMACVSTTTASS